MSLIGLYVILIGRIPALHVTCIILHQNGTKHLWRGRVHNFLRLLEKISECKLPNKVCGVLDISTPDISTPDNSTPRHFNPRQFNPQHFNPRHFNPRQFNPPTFQPPTFQPPYKSRIATPILQRMKFNLLFARALSVESYCLHYVFVRKSKRCVR